MIPNYTGRDTIIFQMGPHLTFYVEYFQSYEPVGTQSRRFGDSVLSLPLADALGLYFNQHNQT